VQLIALACAAEVLLADNGSEITANQGNAQMFLLLGSYQTNTVGYHPASNGRTGRAHESRDQGRHREVHGRPRPQGLGPFFAPSNTQHQHKCKRDDGLHSVCAAAVWQGMPAQVQQAMKGSNYLYRKVIKLFF
jgi:hypothetical protein